MAEFDSKRINNTQHVVKHKQPADLAGCSLSMMLLSSIINISVVQACLGGFFFSLISSACCLHEVAHLQLLLIIIANFLYEFVYSFEYFVFIICCKRFRRFQLLQLAIK